jgi:hypothetical protein
MGTADESDMLLNYVQYIRKSVKWYKKLAIHILDTALPTEHALYLMHNEKNISLPDFQMSVTGRLLKNIKEE